MIGEYGSKSGLIKDLLPAVFSYLAACFMNEEVESKLQILNCISKVIILFYGLVHVFGILILHTLHFICIHVSV